MCCNTALILVEELLLLCGHTGSGRGGGYPRLCMCLYCLCRAGLPGVSECDSASAASRPAVAAAVAEAACSMVGR